MNDNNLKFAVLVDGENSQHRKYKDVLGEIGSKGSIAIKWVYADWSIPTNKGWKDVLVETGSCSKQQFHLTTDSADHALIMDAIELICTNARINAICIVSSDGGFTGVAQRIREKGLHVMGIGKTHTPNYFRNACHDFVYIENLGQEEEERPADQSSPESLDELLLQAYWKLTSDGAKVYLGDLGMKLKEIDSAFDPRNYGYQTLKRLIQNKSSLFVAISEREDQCFVLLADTQGEIKLTPNKGSNFAFLVSKNEEFYFKKEDLSNECNWSNIKKGQMVSFQRTDKQTGKAPHVTNVYCTN